MVKDAVVIKFHRFIVFMWTGEIYTNMLRVARVLFRKRRKKFSVFKNIRLHIGRD